MSQSMEYLARFWVKVGICIGLAFLIFLLILPLGPRPSRGSRDSKVVTEIRSLEQGLMVFKTRFGVLPPSHIVLCEDSTTGNYDPESKSRLRQLWPNFDFTQDYDLNADGDTHDEFHLAGAECLVWFLGGLRDENGRFIGFSKDPLVPFSTVSADRDGSIFEFDLNRLTDVDKDGFAEYGDPISETPYLYASAERGRYRSRDLAVYPDDDKRNMAKAYVDVSKKGIRMYQIISAGEDGEYGEGGVYTYDDFEVSGTRRLEQDNITSFSKGRLD